VLASALLGESPPTLPVRRLVRVAALFGINENRARVALSRMAQRGEVAAADGDYTLRGRLLERSARLRTARTGATGHDDGRWHLVVVAAGSSSPQSRRARRGALRAARLAELREGVWTRPANLALDLDAATRRSVQPFTSVPEEDPLALAAGVFDLAGWARRAGVLAASLDRCALTAEGALAEGFELDAEVLRHLQRDPLLPESLWPPAWPGPTLRERFEGFDRRYRALLADAHRRTAR
jgi:phenylacetic acid degradation operon negative regulatory protein